MQKDKGILGRLLSIVGVILVLVGVFVFQGISRADDTTGPMDSGGIAQVGGASDAGGTNNDGTGDTQNGTVEPSAGSESTDVSAVNSYVINYYTAHDVLNDENEVVTEEILVESATHTGFDTEYEFEITETKPEGEGDFIGWYDAENDKNYVAGDKITLTSEKQELKLIAKFAVRRVFAMKYDANGGNGAPKAQSCESYYETCEFKISETVPTRDGYEFRGWQKEGDDSTVYAPTAIVKSDSYDDVLILKAMWAEIKTYTLLYDANGGNGALSAQTCKSANGGCEITIHADAPSRSGYQFLNWQKGTESVEAGATVFVNESITMLVANWNKIAVFTMTYVAENAENIPEAQKCETAMGTCTFKVPEKEPTKAGFSFRGWKFEDKEDMLAKAGDEIIVGIDGPLELKIYAVWSRIYAVLNSGEVFGAGERVTIRSVANYGDFKELSLDSQVVPESYYTIQQAGATTILLSNAFSQSLSSGEHAFKITWADGEANGIISVNQSEDGSKRFVVVDASGTTDGSSSLMYRPKAGAVNKESTSATTDSAKDNQESNFDAVRTLVIVAVAAFVVIYIVNRFYVRRKMDFIEEL